MSDGRSTVVAVPRLEALTPAPAGALPRKGFGPGVLLLVPALGLSAATPNPWPTAASLLSLALIVRWLWRPGLPPVLLLVCGMQWLQGALLTFYADALGVELWTLTYARHIEEATYRTLAWVTLIAFGASLAVGQQGVLKATANEVPRPTFSRLLLVYCVWTVALPLLSAVAPPAARQLVASLTALRWAVVFACFAHGWATPQSRLAMVGLLCFEIGVGFLSFFAGFKTPLFVFAIAVASTGYRLKPRQIGTLTLVFAATLYLGVVWSAIKMDYRDKLNGGQGVGSQRVELSPEGRVEALFELAGAIDAATLEKGAEQLVRRIAYIEYFAYALDHVPSRRPHEEGRIWANAFAHVFVPRVLFPDKAPLESDTAIAERYTGLTLSSSSGTSITIGLPAETYVDLGPLGMFVVPLLLGLLYGSGYRYFVSKRRAGVVAQGVAVAMHLPYTTVGAASTKILGGYISLLIVALFVWHFGWPRLERFLRMQAR